MNRKVAASTSRKRTTPAAPSGTPRRLQCALLDAMDDRSPTGTIFLSEIARAVWPESWQEHMEEVRQAAAELCAAELLQTTQRGTLVSITSAKGPVRLKGREANPPAAAFPGRLGLCCQFVNEPIQFRTTTATSLARMPRQDQLLKVSGLCLSNAQALKLSLKYCAANGIGAFRIGSTLFPVSTHPQVGYHLDDLPDAFAIKAALTDCRTFSAENNIRTSFHPDQFVVLNSNRQDVVERSIEDLAAHARLADLVGADVINIHGGGAFGDKKSALAALVVQISRLPDSIRDRLTLENDDRVFTPTDLLPVCRTTGIPLVYDVHHHRCCPDGLSVAAATEAALFTWNREPLFHLSSPINGWSGAQPERHHDEIDPRDFPVSWLSLKITVDVEAKAKEFAVLKLLHHLKPPANL